MITRRPITTLIAVAVVAVGLAFGAPAQPVAQFGGTAVTASSGNVANASAVATLAAVAGKTTNICGISFTSSGSTAAAVVSPTVTGGISGTMTFTYATVAGVTLANAAQTHMFMPCIPASATGTTIVVTLPALGAGNTNATANAWGFQF